MALWAVTGVVSSGVADAAFQGADMWCPGLLQVWHYRHVILGHNRCYPWVLQMWHFGVHRHGILG